MADRVMRDLEVEVKTLEGVKKYSFVALRRKEAARVFHGVLEVVIVAVANIAEANSQDERAAAIMRAVKTLDFETFWGLARTLLRFVIVDGKEIQDIEETDYFEDRPEELYIATVHAILENWPKLFSRVRESLTGFDPSDVITKLNLSKTRSNPGN
jgi:hypothetical protein